MPGSQPALNLASFVTTYMEPEVEQLMQESRYQTACTQYYAESLETDLSKNFIDV